MIDPNKRAIYLTDTGAVAVVAMTAGETLEDAAAAVIPAGLPFAIVDVADLPTDRTTRNRWTIDPAALTDGVGAAVVEN